MYAIILTNDPVLLSNVQYNFQKFLVDKKKKKDHNLSQSSFRKILGFVYYEIKLRHEMEILIWSNIKKSQFFIIHFKHFRI